MTDTVRVRGAHGDWVALLGCGHRQHVRHDPPLAAHPEGVERPWVTTAAGRASKLGALLECRLCDEATAQPERRGA